MEVSSHRRGAMVPPNGLRFSCGASATAGVASAASACIPTDCADSSNCLSGGQPASHFVINVCNS